MSHSGAPVVEHGALNEAVVKFLFNDQAFKFETLRAARFSVDGGSDIEKFS
jgi:hypothetical protein